MPAAAARGGAAAARSRRLHVAVGVSGGVDSATAALLMKRAGHAVTGVFMRNWDSGDERGDARGSQCPVEQDLKDARRVCRHIGIPLVEVDFTRRYWTDVFEGFIGDVAGGLTPNPDVACNHHIKFDALLRHVRDAMGADALATGHYARTSFQDDEGTGRDPARAARGDTCQLLRGVDLERDQSYFMSTVPHAALAESLFPLGRLTKEQVRRVAADAGIHVANKRSSVGICFVGKKRSFGDFVAAYVDRDAAAVARGEFVDVDTGAVVGEHLGLVHYTYGQRARLAGRAAPWYVVGKDVPANRIYVCRGDDHGALYCGAAMVKGVRWIAGAMPARLRGGGAIGCQYKARYLQPAAACSAVLCDGAGGVSGRTAFEQSRFTRYDGDPLSCAAPDRRRRLSGDSAMVTFGRPARAVRRRTERPGRRARCGRGGRALIDAAAGTSRSRMARAREQITPHQILAVYDGEVCLGGGPIAAPGASVFEERIVRDGHGGERATLRPAPVQ